MGVSVVPGVWGEQLVGTAGPWCEQRGPGCVCPGILAWELGRRGGRPHFLSRCCVCAGVGVWASAPSRAAPSEAAHLP